MRRSRAISALLLLPAIASCRRCGDSGADAGADADAAPSVGEAAVTATAPSSSAPVEAGPATDAQAAEEPFLVADGGASDCKLTYGPSEQPFRGPAALIAGGSELTMIANESGKPRTFRVSLGAPAPPAPRSFVGMRWPPCEVAGRFVYCQGPGGAITRTTLGKADTRKVVEKSRTSARIAAAPIGDGHSVVAWLEVRQTTEGPMIQAFAALDDRAPVRLSDEGAGATTLRMAPRGGGAVAVYLDARTAMVPVHARALSLRGDDLALGEDAVVFVGGAPERGIDLAIGGAGGGLFALIPMPRETLDFGMAAIPIEEPPRPDTSAVWSLYANGLDPAPIAATSDGWVARLVPREKMPGARRVLELGRIDSDGVFSSKGVIVDGRAITDIAIASDPRGVSILYGDPKATWLERRVCPP